MCVSIAVKVKPLIRASLSLFFNSLKTYLKFNGTQVPGQMLMMTKHILFTCNDCTSKSKFEFNKGVSICQLVQKQNKIGKWKHLICC